MTERGFYVPAFYDVQYAEDRTIAGFVAREGTGAPPVVRKAALKTTEAVDVYAFLFARLAVAYRPPPAGP